MKFPSLIITCFMMTFISQVELNVTYRGYIKLNGRTRRATHPSM